MAAVYLDSIEKVERYLGMTGLEERQGISRDVDEDDVGFTFSIGSIAVCQIWSDDDGLQCDPIMPIEEAAYLMLKFSARPKLPSIRLNLKPSIRNRFVVTIESWCVKVVVDNFYYATLTPDYAVSRCAYTGMSAIKGNRFVLSPDDLETAQREYDFYGMLKILESD